MLETTDMIETTNLIEMTGLNSAGDYEALGQGKCHLIPINEDPGHTHSEKEYVAPSSTWLQMPWALQ